LGAQEGERKRKEEEDLLTERAYKNCKPYLNISLAQFYGFILGERLNHVYLVSNV
jgi:hypothetical protein